MTHQRHETAHTGVTCYAERSATVEGVEIIAYGPGAARVVPGVRVGCPR